MKKIIFLPIIFLTVFVLSGCSKIDKNNTEQILEEKNKQLEELQNKTEEQQAQITELQNYNKEQEESEIKQNEKNECEKKKSDCKNKVNSANGTIKNADFQLTSKYKMLDDYSKKYEDYKEINCKKYNACDKSNLESLKKSVDMIKTGENSIEYELNRKSKAQAELNRLLVEECKDYERWCGEYNPADSQEARQ